MTITERDRSVLAAVATYYTLTRAQITRLCFPDDQDGRITRRRLQILLDTHLLNRTTMEVVNPAMGAPAPVYYPSVEGCRYLVQETDDERYFAACTQTPNWQHLYHWVAVAETHILLDQACAATPGVRKVEWYGEWSVVNADEPAPEKRYRLYSLLNVKPRLVCAPDAAFLLEKDGFRKVFYLEQDRDTTASAQRLAAHKTPGYATLADRCEHRRHFPTTNVDAFAVLMIVPSPRRRDALRKEFADKPGAALWRFASTTDLSAESLLFSPVFHKSDGEVVPLVKGANP